MTPSSTNFSFSVCLFSLHAEFAGFSELLHESMPFSFPPAFQFYVRPRAEAEHHSFYGDWNFCEITFQLPLFYSAVIRWICMLRIHGYRSRSRFVVVMGRSQIATSAEIKLNPIQKWAEITGKVGSERENHVFSKQHQQLYIWQLSATNARHKYVDISIAWSVGWEHPALYLAAQAK